MCMCVWGGDVLVQLLEGEVHPGGRKGRGKRNRPGLPNTTICCRPLAAYVCAC
jgi:hypothetical protein